VKWKGGEGGGRAIAKWQSEIVLQEKKLGSAHIRGGDHLNGKEIREKKKKKKASY